MNATDFDAPLAVRRLEYGTVEVDKKLVGVGNSGSDRTSEADFSSHVCWDCKSSASMKHQRCGDYRHCELALRGAV
jgi:hypothetical protein